MNYDVTEDFLRTQKAAIPLAALAKGNIRKPPPLIEDLLLQRTVTMISAEPHVGKTMLMLAIALSLDTGIPLFGRLKPHETKRTLFIGQDASTWDYVEMARRLLKGLNLSPEQEAMLETDMILNDGIVITDPKFLVWLEQWHAATGFEVLMLDSFIDVHNMNENDNSQMRHVARILKKIRDDMRIAVIFAHHVSKPTDAVRSANYSARGATTIAGSIDFHLQLSKVGDRVELIRPKGRGMRGEPSVKGYKIMDIDDETLRLEPFENLSVAECIRRMLPARRNEIVATVLTTFQEVDERSVDNALQRMSRRNEVVNNNGLWTIVGGKKFGTP